MELLMFRALGSCCPSLCQAEQDSCHCSMSQEGNYMSSWVVMCNSMPFRAVLVTAFTAVGSACAESAFPQAGAFPWEFLTLLWLQVPSPCCHHTALWGSSWARWPQRGVIKVGPDDLEGFFHPPWSGGFQVWGSSCCGWCSHGSGESLPTCASVLGSCAVPAALALLLRAGRAVNSNN